MDDLTDGELVRRIAAGAADARAAEELLCRRFAPRARLYGLRHLRDESRALDLVQTVLLALVVAARAGRIEDPDHVHRFVLGICRNTSLTIRATEGRARPVEPEVLGALAPHVVPATEVLDLGALMHCVDALELRAKEVVFLSFQEERDAAEIGELLGLTPGNVRVVRHRALASLRRCLDARQEVGP